MHALWSRWAPPLERSKLVSSHHYKVKESINFYKFPRKITRNFFYDQVTIAYSGSYFGTVISMGVCGLLAENLGWPSIFYVAGTFAVLWWLIWFVLVKECPQDDRFIKRQELDYINSCLGSTANQHVSK